MDWDSEKHEVIMEESQLEEEDDTITALIMSVGIDLAQSRLKQIEAEKIISLAGSVLAIFQIQFYLQVLIFFSSIWIGLVGACASKVGLSYSIATLAAATDTDTFG